MKIAEWGIETILKQVFLCGMWMVECGVNKKADGKVIG
jgi:hypothetical protein